MGAAGHGNRTLEQDMGAAGHGNRTLKQDMGADSQTSVLPGKKPHRKCC